MKSIHTYLVIAFYAGLGYLFSLIPHYTLHELLVYVICAVTGLLLYIAKHDNPNKTLAVGLGLIAFTAVTAYMSSQHLPTTTAVFSLSILL